MVDLACPRCATPADVAIVEGERVRLAPSAVPPDTSLAICAGCGALVTWERGGLGLAIVARGDLAALRPEVASRLAAASDLARFY